MPWIVSLYTSRTIQARLLSILVNTVFNLKDSWIVTLLGVKTRVGHRLSECLHLLEDLFPGRLRDKQLVAISTIDTEYITGAEATKEAVWIRNFINDLRVPGVFIDTVPLYIDNNSALKLTRNLEFHSRSKHIDVKH